MNPEKAVSSIFVSVEYSFMFFVSVSILNQISNAIEKSTEVWTLVLIVQLTL